MKILCLLRDGEREDAGRWADALAAENEVEVIDLSAPGVAYGDLVERIFAADRVITW